MHKQFSFILGKYTIYLSLNINTCNIGCDNAHSKLPTKVKQTLKCFIILFVDVLV